MAEYRTDGIGRFAAVGACAAAIGYGLPQILQVLGVLPTPLDRWLIFIPSLALAPLFVVTVAASAAQATPAQRTARFGALGLAVAYAVLVSALYVLQLGLVLPAEGTPDAAALAPYRCCEAGRPLTAIDLLGYTYMSLSTLLLGTSYRQPWVRWPLIANGVLAPAILLQLAWPVLIFWASPWLVVFPLAMAALARTFARPGR